jgi:hypothetical protein
VLYFERGEIIGRRRLTVLLKINPSGDLAHRLDLSAPPAGPLVFKLEFGNTATTERPVCTAESVMALATQQLGKTPAAMRPPDEFKERVGASAAGQDDVSTRSEAVNRLVEIGLTRAKMKTAKPIQRAAKKASKVIDGMASDLKRNVIKSK